jgi:uncharacterized protein (TIGR02453 family)
MPQRPWRSSWAATRPASHSLNDNFAAPCGQAAIEKILILITDETLMKAKIYFTPDLFKFLKDLSKNNNRDWFAANKARYEAMVRDPLLQFIADFSGPLDKLNPNFVANPKPVGGSMFRIYRDVRFSADKSPYKTHASAYFPHSSAGKSDQSPGYYFHLEPNKSFAAAGLWHPDAINLKKIRAAIIANPKEWQKVRKGKFPIEGAKLTRPPKGYAADHPLIEELKLKDFVSSVTFTNEQICGSNFMSEFVAAYKDMTPLMKFLTQAMELEW